MPRHKKHTNPVPPGNRPKDLPGSLPSESHRGHSSDTGGSFQEQDPKRRLGDFGGAGEHPRQQPTQLNDGTVHSD